MKKVIAKIPVSCPECGHQQQEYPDALATTCRSCGHYFTIRKHDTIRHIKKARASRVDIKCFKCSHLQPVPQDVASWECSSCGAHLDITTHHISNSHKAAIYTYKGIIITHRGHFLGSRAEAEWINIAGTSSGILIAKQTLTVDGNAKIRARASAEHFEVEQDASLESQDELHFQTAHIQGRVKAKKIVVTGRLTITPSGALDAPTILFGSLMVESGGILKGRGTLIQSSGEIQ